MSNCIPESFTIPVGKKLYTTLDIIDVDLAAFKWYPKKASNGNIYAQRYGGLRFRGEHEDRNGEELLHRIVLERILGRKLQGDERPDHVNGDKLDNRRKNIRLADRAQNAQNVGRHKDNTSGYKGVYWDKNVEKWRAMIMARGVRYQLGTYDTPEEGHAAYCAAAEKLHGEFARFA